MMDKRCWITEGPLKPEVLIEQVTRKNTGAINTCIGTVCELTNGKRTLCLEYDAYFNG